MNIENQNNGYISDYYLNNKAMKRPPGSDKKSFDGGNSSHKYVSDNSEDH